MASLSAVFNPADNTRTGARALIFSGVTPGVNTLTIDVTTWLGVAPSDDVADVVATVMPNRSTGDLVVDSISWQSGIITLNLLGGVAGMSYLIQTSVTALDGRTVCKSPELRFF